MALSVCCGLASFGSAAAGVLPASPDWTYTGLQAGARAGAGISTMGDVNGDGYSDLAVGAPRQLDQFGEPTGAVLQFFGSAGGLPLAPNAMIGMYHSPGQPSPGFGGVVAPAGDFNGDGFGDLLVSAPEWSTGNVLLHLGSPTGLAPDWRLDFFIIDADPAPNYWGTAIAPAGDVDGDGRDDLLIGSPHVHANNTGAAKLWSGNATPDQLTPLLWEAVGPDELSWFGASVAGLGDVNGDGYDDFAVGALQSDNYDFQSGTSYPLSGSVGIYHGQPGGPGVGAAPHTLLIGTQFGAEFGVVSAAGDMNGDGYADVAVAAPGWDLPGRSNCGRVTVYPGSAGGVLPAPIWEGFGGVADATYGMCLAAAGDVNGDGLGDLAIASRAASWNATIELLTGSRFAPHVAWSWLTPASASNPGLTRVATAGDVDGDGYSDLVVSQPDDGASQQGRVFLFRGRADAPAADYGWFAEGDQGGVYYGWDVATAGDVNGDGYSDMLLTAPGYSAGGNSNGVANLFLGGPNGASEGGWYAAGASTGSNFGYAASGIGDVNGDGYDDVAVGAPYEGAGTVYVWHGHPTGLWLGEADWVATGQQPGSNFGISLAPAGDVNGDGYADLVVGAPLDDGDDFGAAGPATEGKAYVYLGSASGLATTPVWSARGGQAGANLGNAVGGAGDVDGDGYDDLVIGSEGWDKPAIIGWLVDAGRAEIYRGGPAGPEALPATTLAGNGNANFGHVVDGAGDIDGDGYGDIIVTAVYSDPNNQGSAHVYRGGAAGLAATAHWNFTTGEAFAALGSSAGYAGDVNNDGLSDVIVGAVFGDGAGGQDCGRVWVFAGPLTGAAATTPLREWHGEQGWENLGNVVAGVGDLNGDGFGDVASGAPGFTGVDWGSGRVVAWYGNNPLSGDDVVPRRVIQMAANVAQPIGLGGLTSPGLDFSVRLRSANPAGRTDVRLEWQVAGPGQLLGGAVQRGPWSDAMPYGAPTWYNVNSGPLTPPGPGTAHWRARLATKSPYFPHSPWLSPARNGREQADLRRRAYVAGVADGVVAARPVRLEATPNPFNPRTEVAFELPRGGRVQVQVFDVAGRLVRTLLDEPRVAGRVAVEWDGADAEGRAVASGTYFARATGGGIAATAKLTLVR